MSPLGCQEGWRVAERVRAGVIFESEADGGWVGARLGDRVRRGATSP